MFENIIEQVNHIGLFWYIVSQVFATIGVIACFLAPRQKAPHAMRKMRGVNIVGAIANLLSFLILGAFGGIVAMIAYGTSVVILFVADITGFADDKARRTKALQTILLLAVFGVGIWQFSAPIDTFSLAANTLGMLAMLYTGPRGPHRARITLLLVSLLWLTYNILIGSLFGLLGSIIISCSCLDAIRRKDQ